MKVKTREILGSVLFFIIGVYFVVGSGKYSAANFMVGDVGSAYVPKLLGGCLIIMSIALFIHTIFVYRKPKGDVAQETKPAETENEATKSEVDYIGGGVSIVLLISYGLLLKPVGFIFTTMLYLFLQIMVLSYRKEKKYVIPAALFSVVFPIAVYLIWYYVFNVPLPAGFLPLHLWL